MPDVQLHFSTGDPIVDRVMRGYIAAFEAAFPGRLHCFVVAGGYAEGTATPLSDIDGGPVFHGQMTHDEWQRAEALIRACSDLARIHLDAGAGSHDRLYVWRDTGDEWVSGHAVEQRYYAKLAYRVIWGDDYRDAVLLPPFEYWTRACFFGPHHMGSAAYFIAAARHPDRANDPAGFRLTHPVDLPDPDDAYFGYARHPLTARDGTVHPTTRTLVRTVLSGANALVAWRARRFVASKADVAGAYRSHVGGPWADLIESADQLCRVHLRYRLPENNEDRRRLRALCAEVPGFENFILEQHRAFVLDQLSLAADESAPLADGDWIPAELAAWLLECSCDDVQALGAAGSIPSRLQDARTAFASRPCLQRWGAAVLGRVLFPSDNDVIHALDALAHHPLPLVHDEARASLSSIR